jgi:hypothetical protein
VITTRAGQLEYEFTLAPGVDPSTINIAVDGADQLVLDSAGDLRMRVARATVVQHAPHAHEIVHGVRRSVAAWFQLQSHHRIAFAVGRHDATAPLVIDPVLTSSTSLLGSRGFDEGSAIALDAAGNAYITGVTSSTNFPTTSGALQTTNAGGVNAFVSKLDATETALLYSTYLGGTGVDLGLGIPVNDGRSGHGVARPAPTTLFSPSSAPSAAAKPARRTASGASPIVVLVEAEATAPRRQAEEEGP